MANDVVLDVLDILIEETYWLVKDTTTGLWNLALPIRRTPTFKKVSEATKNAADKTKNVALKGWKVVAPISQKGVDYTKGGIKNTKNAWKYVAPKIRNAGGAVKNGTIAGAGHFKNAALIGWEHKS